MKKVKKYKCELCGAVFDCEEDALACEKKHAVPRRVEQSIYSNVIDNDIYPCRIVFYFDNGKRLLYRRVPSEK